MNEPKRWLLDSPPPEIRALLEHARSDHAPPRVLRGTLVALGTTSATTAMAGAGAAASTGAKVSMLSILLKWGGAGLLAGTVVASGAAGVDHLAVRDHAAARSNVEHAPPVVTAANPSPDLPRAEAPRATPAEPAAVEAPPAGSAERASVTRPPSAPAARASETAPSPAATVPEPAPTTEAASAQEVALVDGAMRALRAGDAAGAARSLAGYETRFVPAHLEPEVLFLRMAAAQARGDAAEAGRNAKLIVSRYPKSPGVGRAAEILRAPSVDTKE